MIQCDEVFLNLTKELSNKNLIALCEVDTDFFGMIDTIHIKKEQTAFEKKKNPPGT